MGREHVTISAFLQMTQLTVSSNPHNVRVSGLRGRHSGLCAPLSSGLWGRNLQGPEGNGKMKGEAGVGGRILG